MKLNLRSTKLYKGLNSYLACAYAEGFCEGEGASEKDQLVAWQWISDHGTWKHLQGFYGRSVQNLLEARLISPAK